MSSPANDIHALLSEADAARSVKRFERAKAIIRSAVEAARRSDDPKFLGRALNDLARIERDLNNLSSSISLYKDLVRLHQDHGDPPAAAHALRHLGDIYLDEGSLDAAERHYEQALEIYEKERVSGLARANALRGYALLQEQKNDLGKALSLWKEARSLYEQQQVDTGVKECSDNIKKLA